MSDYEKRMDIAKGIIQRARGHLSLLCKKPSLFRMSIPVQEDDSDIIIDRALNEGWRALQEIERLKAEINNITPSKALAKKNIDLILENDRLKSQLEKAEAVVRDISKIGLRCSNERCEAEDGVKRAREYFKEKEGK